MSIASLFTKVAFTYFIPFLNRGTSLYCHSACALVDNQSQSLSNSSWPTRITKYGRQTLSFVPFAYQFTQCDSFPCRWSEQRLRDRRDICVRLAEVSRPTTSPDHAPPRYHGHGHLLTLLRKDSPIETRHLRQHYA